MSVRLSIGGYAPQDSSHSAAVEHLRDELVGTIDGVEVDVLWNVLDEGRPAPALLEMVASGELTMCYFSTSYLGKSVPQLDALEVPYLFGSLDHAHRALDGDFGAALTVATEAATPYRVLGYWDNGFRHITNAIRPIRAPADLAGMRVRLQPNRFHEALIEAWGAVPVPVELSAGIAMITAGEVDAQENPLANTVAYGVDTVHGHASMTGHLYGARGLYANAEAIDALDDGQRTAVYAAARSAITLQRRLAEEKELALRTQLESDGMAFVDLSHDELSAFVDAAAPVQAAARDELGGDLLDSAGT